jgi:hypothetical protein
MVKSTIEDKIIKDNSAWTKPQIITTFIAIISFLISGWVFIDANFVTKLDVIAGRQIRLYVAFEDEEQRNPQPCIMMTMMYANRGGKTGTVFDTKLDVKWLRDNKILLQKEFKALRELDNFIMAQGHFTQKPISPVVVLGKSNEIRSYIFSPYETIRQEDIVQNFDLEIEVYTQTMNEWSLRSRYRVDNVSDVWLDLTSDTTFRAKVLDIREIR